MSVEFQKIIHDFVCDLKTTFPEYTPLIDKWWKDDETSGKFVLEHCKKKMPPRFFDILNQNEDMFKEESGIDTEFLPNIYFKSLWGFDITQTTRDTIWKYLQLMLFSIVGSIDNKEMFGDTAKMFDDVDGMELKTKLEEALKNMQGMFDNMKTEAGPGADGSTNAQPGANFPNAEDIHDHISGMLDGKLGKLAKEIAEDAANDLNIDMDNVTDVKDVFTNLLKNPTKLTGLVKNVGSKLDSKIKSGELKESELIAEAAELMKKMKNMPGMGDIQSMLNKMGMQGAMGGMGGANGKVNMGAMESQLNRNMKAAQMKERIRAKAEVNRILREKMEQEKLAQQHANVSSSNVSCEQGMNDEELIYIFSTGEKVEKTPRGAKPTQNKKKKGKK